MPPIELLLTVSPETTWGIFIRLLALIYLIAFLSLGAELLPWAGRRGISPVAEKLDRIRVDFGPWRAFARHPTLLWLGSSDRALRRLPLAGASTAALALLGVASPLMLVASWMIYLSLDLAFSLTFPWESLLLEAGFLAIFLPALPLLPTLRLGHAPEPILMFAFHWLLFRLVFGFGKNKFTREALADPLYLRGFLISQPIPSPLGWRAARLPRPLLIVAHAAMFAVEMGLPVLVFLPGWPRLVAALGITGLMIGIQTMGNFGFFNLLTAILCVTLLDGRSVTSQTLASLASPHGVSVAIAVGWSLLAGLCHLPFNTFAARGWLEWPAWGAVKGLGGAILGLLRAAMPFRTVHAYGVFPPRMGFPGKVLPVVEGTLDGQAWEPFEYRYMTSTEASPPRFVAPHCPRLDHMVLYEGAGVGSGNYLGTLFSAGNPYDFSNVTFLDRLLERLMETDSPVRRMFRVVPFGSRTPARMRIRSYLFAPARPEEMQSTGKYWHRTYVSEDLPERGPNPLIGQRWLPAPEQFHPDERWARRRVHRLAPLLTARTLDEVRSMLDPTARSKWSLFWEELIPQAQRAAEEGWTAILGLAQRFEAHHGGLGLDDLDRIRGAVTTALLERLEPRTFGWEQPLLAVGPYFRASAVAHALVLAGRNRVADALASVEGLPSEPAEGVDRQALMLLTLFRRSTLIMHARKQRLLSAVLPPQAATPDAVPGFLRLLPVLAEVLSDPSERIPNVAQRPDGEWTLDGIPMIARR